MVAALFATPIEYIENYYPVLVESYRPVKDSGGAGLHRGGAGIEKVYRLLEPGKVSIHDDREVVPPWGINGGLFGGTSSKWLQRAGAEGVERIPSKIDNLAVGPGDRLVYITAGSGGWGDPLDRDPALVARDVGYDLVSADKAGRITALFWMLGQGRCRRDRGPAHRDADSAGAPEPFSFGFTPPDRVAAE